LYERKTRQTITALFACIMFACAFAAAPLVHKHFPSHQGAAHDYDASCSWIKTEKNNRDPSAQQLFAIAPLLFFLVAFFAVTFRRAEPPLRLTPRYTTSYPITRAPPAR
jgi:hypothetical protein